MIIYYYFSDPVLKVYLNWYLNQERNGLTEEVNLFKATDQSLDETDTLLLGRLTADDVTVGMEQIIKNWMKQNTFSESEDESEEDGNNNDEEE